MKNILFSVAWAACLLLSGALYAQEWQGTVDVPYDFVIGDTILPAGTYAVRTERTRLILTNLETGASAFTTDADFRSRTNIYVDNPNSLFIVGLNGRHSNKAHDYDPTQGKRVPAPR